ncbi:hypothetical protein E2C01_064151 [Portunus trituberculatus]|uniref:Uncharacterized protein n=1 Tax=Portunus trituberculatus TaxID=210409 RepID=A0A5B7HMH6_PORTR|nr:hypothetical protein [Portunus trituberculatus]
MMAVGRALSLTARLPERDERYLGRPRRAGVAEGRARLGVTDFLAGSASPQLPVVIKTRRREMNCMLAHAWRVAATTTTTTTTTTSTTTTTTTTTNHRN